MAAKFGAREVARLETVYASPAIAAQRARTRAVLGARPGERGLDVGCGPAFLACELGREVGPGGRIVGLDESPEMLEAARARIAREGLADRVEVQEGDAARLAFPAAAFDFVTAVQVYLYVPDVEGALAEAARVLRPGGRLAVVDTDWDSCVWLTADRDRHRRVMEARGAILRPAASPGAAAGAPRPGGPRARARRGDPRARARRESRDVQRRPHRTDRRPRRSLRRAARGGGGLEERISSRAPAAASTSSA